MRIINHHYTIPFEPVFEFDYSYVNGPVSYNGYQQIEKEIPLLSIRLRDNTGSRQVIYTLNNKTYMSCLISTQWLLDESTLHCVVNFRSQHEIYGRPMDSELIKYWCTDMLARLKYYNVNVDQCLIYVNVGDYHNHI